MENKQSAIEWAEDKLSDLNSAVVNGEIASEEYHEIRVNIWKKAKAMEKEQIKDSFINYFYNDNLPLNDKRALYKIAEKYYNETYGQI